MQNGSGPLQYFVGKIESFQEDIVIFMKRFLILDLDIMHPSLNIFFPHFGCIAQRALVNKPGVARAV